MLTREEMSVLGHAYWDGKTLQWECKDTGEWLDCRAKYGTCPDFRDGFEWRIKPNEPKTITICTFMSEYGRIRQAVKGLGEYVDLEDDQCWTHIKSLDQVVEVE